MGVDACKTTCLPLPEPNLINNSLLLARCSLFAARSWLLAARLPLPEPNLINNSLLLARCSLFAARWLLAARLPPPEPN